MATSLDADAYFPFDGSTHNAAEAEWRKMAQHWRGSGVIRGEDNGCAVSVVSSDVRVATGKAWIKGHYGELTSNKDLTPTAAHATLARIDRVVWQVHFTNNTYKVVLLAGTANANPITTIPTLTQSATVWETHLALVLVAASTGALTVTDEREYARGVGQPPVGSVLPYAGTAVPDGWLACVGQTVNRWTYADLFFWLGTTFGAGDGLTTFGLPDLRARVPVGPDVMFGSADAARIDEGDDLSEVGGSANQPTTTGTTSGQSANHQHVGVTTGGGTTAGVTADHDHTYSQPGGTNSNLPPYQILNYIIRT